MKPAAWRSDPNRYGFSMTLTPRFADMDIVGHLNNIAIAEFHEEARVRFLCHLFGEDFLFRERPYRLLVARAAYDYLREAHYPEPLEARVGVLRIGHRSFELALSLFQMGQCVGLSEVIGVAVDARGEQGATPLPDELRRGFERYLIKTDDMNDSGDTT